jgi:hypothetical protein
MKTHLQCLVLLYALACAFTGPARAAGTTVEILDDTKLASIRGGYCNFWKCEGPPGDGDCQTIPDDTPDLCATVTCKLDLGSANGTDVVDCEITHEAVTCSEEETYIRCIPATHPNICVPKLDSGVCGLQVETYCVADIKHRRCVCISGTDEDPCEWQNCLY